MITVSDLALSFNGQNLFSHVNLLFQPGNCYGVIGANGAGKSTFLKILSGELEPTKGEVVVDEKSRMSVLKQDHFAYEQYTVFETILQGNPRLYEVLKEKDALYEKEDFSEEDGIRAADLEAEFAELGGWDAETEAGKLLQGLGLDNMMLYSEMSSLTEAQKVKVLLARALFGQPDIILLDEPTNGLDNRSTGWKIFCWIMRAPSLWSLTTGIFSTMSARTSWISITPKSSFMWGTTISGMNPAS